MTNRKKAIAQQLSGYQADFTRGDRESFLRALILCLSFKLPLPDWLSDHLLIGTLEYMQAKVRTLDEAFGVKRPKSWRKPKGAERKNYDLAPAACLMVSSMLEHKKVSVIENGKAERRDKPDIVLLGAVEIVAQKLEISEVAVKRAYYNEKIRAELGFSQTSKKSDLAKRPR